MLNRSKFSIFLAFFFALNLTACAMPKQAPGLSPFTTDGCSNFPDHALIGKADWHNCCVVHDLAYWRGGTADERLKADEGLKACVHKATQNGVLASLMYEGVRLGGGAYFYTSYRWAYGWPYGRGYQALTKEEDEQAKTLASIFLKANPQLLCVLEGTACKAP